MLRLKMGPATAGSGPGMHTGVSTAIGLSNSKRLSLWPASMTWHQESWNAFIQGRINDVCTVLGVWLCRV